MIKALIALDSHPGIAIALMNTAFELQPEHADRIDWFSVI